MLSAERERRNSDGHAALNGIGHVPGTAILFGEQVVGLGVALDGLRFRIEVQDLN